MATCELDDGRVIVRNRKLFHLERALKYNWDVAYWHSKRDEKWLETQIEKFRQQERRAIINLNLKIYEIGRRLTQTSQAPSKSVDYAENFKDNGRGTTQLKNGYGSFGESQAPLRNHQSKPIKPAYEAYINDDLTFSEERQHSLQHPGETLNAARDNMEDYTVDKLKPTGSRVSKNKQFKTMLASAENKSGFKDKTSSCLSSRCKSKNSLESQRMLGRSRSYTVSVATVSSRTAVVTRQRSYTGRESKRLTIAKSNASSPINSCLKDEFDQLRNCRYLR